MMMMTEFLKGANSMKYKILLLVAGSILLAIVCCTTANCGDDDLATPAGIKLPVEKVAIQSDEDQVVSTLPADTWYAIESQTELMVLASPVGLVQIAGDHGSIKAMGFFSDGTPGKIEVRTYTAPYVYFVTSVKKGTAELIIVPVGATSEQQIVRQTLAVLGARPPPGPKSDDPVEPIASFRVIFVKESGATLSPEQTAIPAAKVIRDYLNAKTTKEDGQPGWREYDPQQTTANEQPTMSALWAAVKAKVETVPALVIEVNGHATVMPFPANVDEAMATLRKYGGD